LRLTAAISSATSPAASGNPGQAADEQEKIEPGGHEGEIHQPGKGDEDAADDQHALPVLLMHQKGKQEKQDKEGARIEGVEAGQQDGEQRQR
jgi:hypothetical protein